MTVTLERPSSALVAPPSPPARRRSLDGLRGIAALLVVAMHTHIDAFQQGFLGVDVFFVLSGFLITGLLVSRSQSYGTFLTRRAVRLVPALGVALLVISLQQWLSTGLDARCAALAVTHTMDVRALGAQRCAGPLHITWSLAFEEQFYLVWPLVLLALVRVSRRVAAGGLLLGWLANAVRMAFLTSHHRVVSDRFLYAPDGRALSILLGGAVALLVSDPRTRTWLNHHHRLSVAPTLAGIVLVVVPLLPHRDGSWWDDSVRALGGDVSLASSVGAGSALLVLGLAWSGERAWAARLLAWRPLVAAGAISYSLYLLHLVPITIARAWLPGRTHLSALVGVSAALVLATMSRHLVERPVQRRFAG